MAIVILSSCRNKLIEDLGEHLQVQGLRVRLVYLVPRPSDPLRLFRLYRGLYQGIVFLSLLRFFRVDQIHAHYISPNIIRLAPYLKFLCRRLIWTIWGSDFREFETLHIGNAKKINKYVDSITTTSEAMASGYKNAIGFHKDIFAIRFGLSFFEDIAKTTAQDVVHFKNKYKIPLNKSVVVCGASASPLHAQHKISQSIAKIQDTYIGNCFFVFPLTYGSDEAKNKILEQLKTFPFPYIALTEYLFNKELASLRKATDIFINMPSHDQMQGAMIEAAFAGAQIITGDWLRYEEFEAVAGEAFHKIPSYDEISKPLEKILSRSLLNKDVKASNTCDIKEFCGWDSQINKWVLLYNEHL